MVKYRKLKQREMLKEPLCRWLTWFNRNSSTKMISEVVNMDKAIQTANERLEYISGDEEARRAYMMRFKAMCDYTSTINYATEKGYNEGIEKGREQGMEEGQEKGRIEVAKNLFKIGYPIDEIIKVTGLTFEKINFALKK